MLTALCSTTSSTRTRRISSSSCARSSSSLGCSPSGGAPPCCCCSSSATDCSLRCVGPAGLLHRAAVDLFDRRALGEVSVGALRAVPLGQLHIDAKRLPRRACPL